MTITNYAFIKDNIVINSVLFEEPIDEQFLEHLKNEFLLNDILPLSPGVGIGYSYRSDLNAFIPPKINCHAEEVLDETTCRWTCSNAEHMEITK